MPERFLQTPDVVTPPPAPTRFVPGALPGGLRPLTDTQAAHLRRRIAELAQQGATSQQILSTVQKEAILLQSGFGAQPTLLDNAVTDVSEFVHGVGSLIGSVAIEGVIDPIAALIQGEPGKAADEFFQALKGGGRFLGQLPGAVVEGLRSGVLGSIANLDAQEFGERFHNRPVTAVLDLALPLAAVRAVGALGAASRITSVARTGRALRVAGEVLDPVQLAARGIGRVVRGKPGVFPVGGIAGRIPALRRILEERLIKRTTRGLELQAVGRFREQINGVLRPLHALPIEEQILARDVAEGLKRAPAGVSAGFNDAVEGYNQLFRPDGDVTKFLIDSGHIGSVAEAEARNWKALAGRAIKEEGLPLTGPGPTGLLELDDLRAMTKASDIRPFIDSWRNALGLDAGFNPAYVTYMRGRSTFQKAASWWTRVFGQEAPRRSPSAVLRGINEPRVGILKRLNFETLEDGAFTRNLRDALIEQTKELEVLVKFQARLSALATDTNAIALPLRDIVRTAIGDIDPATLRVTASGVTGQGAGGAARQIPIDEVVRNMNQEVVRRLRPDLEYRLFSAQGALQLQRDADLAVRGLTSSLSKRQFGLADAVNETLARLSKGPLSIDDLPTIHAMPQQLLEAFERTLPTRGPWSDLARVVFDTPTNFLKKFWLGASPAWLMNTIVGNALFGTMAMGPGILNPMNYYRALSPKWRKIFAPEAGMNLMSEITAETLVRTGDIALKAELFRMPAVKRLGLKVAGSIYRGAAATDEFFRRMVYFREAIPMATKAFHDGVQGGWLKTLVKHDEAYQAAKALVETPVGATAEGVRLLNKARGIATGEVFKWFGDYNLMSRFERTFVRRAVPFWNWFKHMTVLSLRLPIQHPLRSKTLQVLGNVVRDSEEAEIAREFPGFSREELPEFFQSTVGARRLLQIFEETFGFDPSTETDRRLLPLLGTVGMNPFETARDVAESAAAILGADLNLPEAKVGVITGALAPQITIGIEAISGVDLFTGRRFKQVINGVPVEVGKIVQLPGGKVARVGGFLDIAFSRLGDTIPQIGFATALFAPFRRSGSVITGKKETLEFAWNLLNGNFEGARKVLQAGAIPDDRTGRPIPLSRALAAMRIFGFNVKEIDPVEQRRRARKFTLREVGRQFSAFFKAHPRIAVYMAQRGMPVAVDWVRRELRRQARTKRDDIRVRVMSGWLDPKPLPETVQP